MNEELTQPFDPETEAIYCARCGQRLVESGHMLYLFLLCPTHGEFTIAPVVMRVDDLVTGDEGHWEIHFKDRQDLSMWETCQYIDAEGLSGSQTRVGR